MSSDRLAEFIDTILIEYGPRLIRTRDNVVNRQLFDFIIAVAICQTKNLRYLLFHHLITYPHDLSYHKEHQTSLWHSNKSETLHKATSRSYCSRGKSQEKLLIPYQIHFSI